MKRTDTEEITSLLDRVDWNFKDYISTSHPEDINSLHWYPAAFVPQIPAILIQIFSETGDIVLDPFAGSGIALVEAAKQDRGLIGVDSSPFAIDIVKAKFQAINCSDWSWASELKKKIINESLTEPVIEYCRKRGISVEILKWFHPSTTRGLLDIYNCIIEDKSHLSLLKRVIFSSILKSCCSQRKHYTYITDRCFPTEFVRVNSKKKYIQQLELTEVASERFRNYYEKINLKEWKRPKDEIVVGDARNLDWIGDGYVNLVVTSPPYLACNDYSKSMRLTNLFFPEHNIKELAEQEIGARFKRHRKSVQEDYLRDMKTSLMECERVLSKSGHLALVFGQGKGRARKTNVVQFIVEYITNQLNFRHIFDTERDIMFHRVRFPGVKKEHILVFQKQL